MDSSHNLFSSNLVPSARLVVEADFDPQLPTRVLGRFAELGRLPTSFVMTTRRSLTAGHRPSPAQRERGGPSADADGGVREGRRLDGGLAHNLDDELVRMEVEFTAEPDAARLLSRRLLNVPSVRSVELSFRRARIGRAAAA